MGSFGGLEVPLGADVQEVAPAVVAGPGGGAVDSRPALQALERILGLDLCGGSHGGWLRCSVLMSSPPQSGQVARYALAVSSLPQPEHSYRTILVSPVDVPI